MKTIPQNNFNSKKKLPKPLFQQAFHGLAGDIVKAIRPQTEADDAALLIQFLVAFGNCIGRKAFFPVEADKHYMNLFVVLVGNSSKGRKGVSWGHINRLFSQVDATWAAKCIKSGSSSGEGVISLMHDKIEKYVPGKGGEDPSLITIHPGIEDKRILLLETEFGGVLKNLEREGNKLSAIFRDAWDRGNLSTITRNEPLQASNAHLSIVGHITRSELLRYLTQTETANGFANRFMWLCVERSKLLPHGGKGVDLTQFVEPLKKAYQFASKAQEMSFDILASEAWEELYQKLAIEKPGLIGCITARAEPLIIRLAALFALLDCSTVINYEHLCAAESIWTYCENSCSYIFGNATGNAVADKILRALENQPDGLSQTKIIEDIFNRNRSAFEIHEALDLLSDAGLVRSKLDISDRPKVIWYAANAPVNDEVNEINSSNSYATGDQTHTNGYLEY